MSGRLRPDNPLARDLLAVARSELRWLREDGYEFERERMRGAGFSLGFLGSSWISVDVDLSRSAIEVFLAGGRAHPEVRRTSMNRVLRARGETAPATLVPHLASETETIALFRAHLDGLLRLRDDVVAGDWSNYDERQASDDERAASARHEEALAAVRAAMQRNPTSGS
jgi:hypothetical protein